MNPDDIAWELHEDGDCDSMKCPYCEADRDDSLPGIEDEGEE